MSTDRNVRLAFLHNPAFHRPETHTIEHVSLRFIGAKARNATQNRLLERLRLSAVGDAALPGANPLREQCACYEIDARTRAPLVCLNGEPALRDILYLFNVIIALEWNPSPATYQQIRLAALRGSDFLFDVTNGYMAFGHVLIGGPDLMEAADIQVLASNRIHPRAWNAALNEADKFMPIRVGRGLWQKNLETVLTWDNPDGYRGLVHEWGHYAFGLVDAYLAQIWLQRAAVNQAFWRPTAPSNAPWTNTALDLAAPDIALPVESLMSDSRLSEYAPVDEIFQRIGRYYHLMRDSTPLEGPVELPFALPHFLDLRPQPFTAPTFARSTLDLEAPEEVVVPITSAPSFAGKNAQGLIPEGQAHWLHLLKAPFTNGMPQRVVAQGKVGSRDREQGFRLLGAAPDDRVLLVSQVGTSASVASATVARGANGALILTAWSDVSPTGDILNNPFFVDVVPLPVEADNVANAAICVAVTAHRNQWPAAVSYYPSGSTWGRALEWDRMEGAMHITEATPVRYLDGHVLLRWPGAEQGDERYFVCSCSQGGGGGKTSGGGLLPVTGGSSDGNAMVFFNANIAQLADPDLGRAVTLRLVTTTLTVSQPSVALAARSYIFSVAVNEPLTADEDAARSSLILYYDQKAATSGGVLLMYRWSEANRAWEPLSTFAPADLPYLAVPLGAHSTGDLETAPSLTDKNWKQLRVERYRICWTSDASVSNGMLPNALP